MAGESGQVVTITGHDGDRVSVSVPMVGFPQGFELQAGDQVMLTQGENGPAVRPLIRASRDDRAQERAGRMSVADREAVTQRATLRARAQDGRRTVFTVPNEAGEPERVVSIREP